MALGRNPVKEICNHLREGIISVDSSSSILDTESSSSALAALISGAIKSEGDALVVYESLVNFIDSNKNQFSQEFIKRSYDEFEEIISDEKNHIERLNKLLREVDSVEPANESMETRQSNVFEISRRVNESMMTRYEKSIIDGTPCEVVLDGAKIASMIDQYGYDSDSFYNFIFDRYGLEKDVDFTVNVDATSFRFPVMSNRSLKLAYEIGDSNYDEMLDESVTDPEEYGEEFIKLSRGRYVRLGKSDSDGKYHVLFFDGSTTGDLRYPSRQKALAAHLRIASYLNRNYTTKEIYGMNLGDDEFDAPNHRYVDREEDR